MVEEGEYYIIEETGPCDVLCNISDGSMRYDGKPREHLWISQKNICEEEAQFPKGFSQGYCEKALRDKNLHDVVFVYPSKVIDKTSLKRLLIKKALGNV